MRDQEVKVLLEDIRSNFKVFGEALDGQTQKVDRIDKTVSNIDERLSVVEVSVTDISEHLALVEVDVRFIRNQLSQKIDREEFETLENRVVLLEKRLKKALA